MSCHIDELRPSDTNAITLELAQGTRISRFFYGALEEPGLDRQTSELSSNMEGVVFERVISTEERVEEAVEKVGGQKEIRGEMKIVAIKGESGRGESHRSQPEETEEAMESNERLQREDSAGPPHSVTQSTSGTSRAPLMIKALSDVHTQCVCLNSCIQAAASRLQDSSQNNQRAAERVRLLIQVIPRKPTFPLGKLLLLMCRLFSFPVHRTQHILCCSCGPHPPYAV